MRAKIIGGIVVLALVAYAVVSAVRSRPFSPAADLPRGALVYLQIEDLPGFIKLWNRVEASRRNIRRARTLTSCQSGILD
jgi:hypothetical protein